MDRLNLRILLPTREAVERTVDSVNLTAWEGEVGILPGHAPYLAVLRPGPASFRDGGETQTFALGDGFLEVHDDVVTALVQSAERADEIDVARAEQRKAAIEVQLKAEGLAETEMKRFELSLAKQLARIQVATGR